MADFIISSYVGKKAIQELLIKCPNVDRGCDWEGIADSLQKHMESCSIQNLKCFLCLKPAVNPLQHMGCGESFCWKCLAEHDVCPYCGITSMSRSICKSADVCINIT